MKTETKKLFLENYENKGDCKDLQKFIKSFEKEFRKSNTSKTIKYYPWAVIERIFRMQGGEIEVLDWARTVTFKSSDYAPDENGVLVMQEQEAHALFIHLKATWQGETLEEYYPLFDNQNAKIIKTPNALDLNTARQRGSVRLISRLSGIGLEIFEQQDTQFEDDSAEEVSVKSKKEEEPKEVKEEKPKTKAAQKREKDKEKTQEAVKEIVEDEKKAQKQKEPKEEVEVSKPKEKPTQEQDGGFLQGFLKGEEVDPKEQVETIEEEKQKFDNEEFDKESQEYADLLLEVRKEVRNKGAQKEAKDFIKEKGYELLSDLPYSVLSELYEQIK